MFELFEHKADTGVRGIGSTLGKAFEECAKAMFSVMVELKEVKARKEIKVNVKAGNEKELLVEWLNELLYESSVKEMVFSEFKVKIEKSERGVKLKGKALGEKINLKKHHFNTEVKGASYSGLKVDEKNGKFLVQCIVDV